MKEKKGAKLLNVGQSSISRHILWCGVGLALLKYVECPVWHLHKLEWKASLSSLRGLVMFGPLWSFRLSMKHHETFALRRLVFFSSTTYYRLLSIGPKQLFGLWTSVLLEKSRVLVTNSLGQMVLVRNIVLDSIPKVLSTQIRCFKDQSWKRGVLIDVSYFYTRICIGIPAHNITTKV